MTQHQLEQLLEAVRIAVQDIIQSTGYGDINITVVNGVPKDLITRKSIRLTGATTTEALAQGKP